MQNLWVSLSIWTRQVGTQPRDHGEKQGVHNISPYTGTPSVAQSLWELGLTRKSKKFHGDDQELRDFLGDMHPHGVGVGE